MSTTPVTILLTFQSQENELTGLSWSAPFIFWGGILVVLLLLIFFIRKRRGHRISGSDNADAVNNSDKKRVCSSCGKRNTPKSKFCSYCGSQNIE